MSVNLTGALLLLAGLAVGGALAGLAVGVHRTHEAVGIAANTFVETSRALMETDAANGERIAALEQRATVWDDAAVVAHELGRSPALACQHGVLRTLRCAACLAAEAAAN